MADRKEINKDLRCIVTFTVLFSYCLVIFSDTITNQIIRNPFLNRLKLSILSPFYISNVYILVTGEFLVSLNQFAIFSYYQCFSTYTGTACWMFLGIILYIFISSDMFGVS